MEKENSKSKKAHKDWNHIFANGVYFYNLFYDFHTTFGDKELMLFLRFMLERVFILPIELSAADITDAEDKALNIFETINDRGMNLEDADIFDSKDDAIEGLHEALLEGLDTPEAFKDHETNTESYEDWIDWIDYDALDNYEIKPVYATDASTDYAYLTRSGLKESRINDVLIILDEFDTQFPKGNKNRDVYHLTRRLVDYAGLDKEIATEIAVRHLDGKMFNYY